MKYNPMLLTDFYKISHYLMAEKGIEKTYSTFTPRGSRIKDIDQVVFFGLQGFIKEYLIEYFNDNFFNRKKEEVVGEYKRIIKHTLGDNCADTLHIEALHDLGYLPIKIRAIKEGTLVPVKVPTFTIESTIDEFHWLTNFLETLKSASNWKVITTTTIVKKYRDICEKWAEKTCDSKEHIKWQCHNFSYRGMAGNEDAITTGAGHLLFFTGTDTIPSICYLEKYYNANVEKELVGASVLACYDEKTEILTEKGWVLFKNLERGIKVAQYNFDGTIEFIIPSEYYEMDNNTELIHFKSTGYGYTDIMVTPNHRMIRRRKSDKEIQFFEADDQKYHYKKGYGTKNELIVSGFKKYGEKNKLTDIERLKIAFQADGSFPSHSEDYSGIITGCNMPIRFSIKKERKYKRLIEILDKTGYEYTQNKYDNGYYSIWIKSKEEFVKDLSWVELNEINYEWCREFIDELKHWDGHKSSENTISFSSINKSCIDIVCAIASLCGYKSHISSVKDKREDSDRKELFTIILDKTKDSVSGRNIIKSKVKYNGKVYCVSVPTKMLVVRRNNRVCICGNSEHGIQCQYEDDLKYYKRLINEVAPEGIISIVSDGYDYWNVIGNIIPTLKEDIMKRNGKIVPRPDSGDPVDIICGSVIIEDFTNNKYCKTLDDCIVTMKEYLVEEERNETPHGEYGADKKEGYFKYNNKIYKIIVEFEWNRYDKQYYYIDYTQIISCEEVELTIEQKGSIESLWETFGGTINSKGYKVLDPHIGLIYGESITPERAEIIFDRLERKGFSSENIVFGIGSYSLGYYSRDTFNIAVKSTHVVINGEEKMIYKNPKTDKDKIKKSQKGRVVVIKNPVTKEIECVDGLTIAQQELFKADDLLEEVFVDGKLLREDSLTDIRERVEKEYK